MTKLVLGSSSISASFKMANSIESIKARRVKNKTKGVKLPYNDNGAITLAKAIDKLAPTVMVKGKPTIKKAKKVNPHGKAKGKALSANASERRQWCLDNLDACVIVKRETIQLSEIVSENPRPENAIRIRLSTHEKGQVIGYIRYLASPIAKKSPNHKHAESVILYRKA